MSGEKLFVDLTNAYSPAWHERFASSAKILGLTLHEGVYASVVGPQHETPSEVKMLWQLGADAVGMSAVCEMIQARALELEVAGFSCLTNWAAGTSEKTLSHAEALVAGEAAALQLKTLLDLTIGSGSRA